jgi:hypothetical protein
LCSASRGWWPLEIAIIVGLLLERFIVPGRLVGALKVPTRMLILVLLSPRPYIADRRPNYCCRPLRTAATTLSTVSKSPPLPRARSRYQRNPRYRRPRHPPARTANCIQPGSQDVGPPPRTRGTSFLSLSHLFSIALPAVDGQSGSFFFPSFHLSFPARQGNWPLARPSPTLDLARARAPHVDALIRPDPLAL